MEISGQWSDIKSFATARSISIQYVLISGDSPGALTGTYFIWAIDGPISLYTRIQQVNPVINPSDQYDFETNYISTANVPIATKITPKPFIDNTISGSFTGIDQTLQISTVGCSTVQYGTVNHSLDR